MGARIALDGQIRAQKLPGNFLCALRLSCIRKNKRPTAEPRRIGRRATCIVWVTSERAIGGGEAKKWVGRPALCVRNED